MPGVVNSISGHCANGECPRDGVLPAGSVVKAFLNCSFMESAFAWSVVTGPPAVYRVGMPTLSCLVDLTYRKNRFTPTK